jgi:cyclophilin family peptidyl-prolyl cis-trans isomerase/HEAT repeat protein
VFLRRTLTLAVFVCLLATPLFAQVDQGEAIAKILQAEDSLKYEPFLADLALDPDRPARVREMAARAIGHIGDTNGAAQLLKGLDAEGLDQAVVAHYLGLAWANTPEWAFEVRVPPVVARKLLKLTSEKHPANVRAAAFEALALARAGVGYREARAVIDEVAGGNVKDSKPLVLAILRVAGTQGAEQPMEPPPLIQERKAWRQDVLAFGLADPDLDIAYHAAYWAAREDTKELELTAPLIKALERQATDEAKGALGLLHAKALAALAMRAENGDAVKTAARNMLLDGSLQAKISAARAMAKLLPAEQAYDELIRALRDAGSAEVTSLHQAIFETLAELKLDGLAKKLWALSEQNVMFRRLAQLAAARAGARDEVVGLLPTDFSETDEDALHYVALLDAAGAEQKIEWLAGGRSVPVRFVKTVSVRRAVALALAYDGNSEPTTAVMDKHENWLMDPDPIIRVAAVISLGATGDPERIQQLIGVAKRAQTDPTPDVTLAVFDALEQLGKSKDANVTADVVAGEMARVGLDDRRLTVRRRSAATIYRLTREMHKKPLYGVATGKSLADYETLARRLIDGGDASTRMMMRTNKGVVRFVVRRDAAPLAADNFIRLAITEYYDGLFFHRVVPQFVAQTGDPQRLGWGGPGYEIRDEEGVLPFTTGALGMASAGHDTAGGQFFFTVVPTPHLDGRYTVFGLADDASLAVLEKLVEGDQVLTIRTDSGD